jgi:ATP-dependent Clp protease adapter protein ClpS
VRTGVKTQTKWLEFRRQYNEGTASAQPNLNLRLPFMQMMKLLRASDLQPFLMASETVVAPSEIGAEETTEQLSDGFRVILYNDEHHSMDEVILQLQKATGCNMEKAIDIMLEAHTKGRAVCYKGGRDDCQKVCRVLREIRLQCEVDCD